jgi:hypothetical protein
VEKPDRLRKILAINYLNVAITLAVTFLNIIISALGYSINDSVRFPISQG